MNSKEDKWLEGYALTQKNSIASLIILVFAWALFALNLIIEANFFFALRNDPIFNPATGAMDSAISITAGMSAVLHIIFLIPIATVIIVATIILRRGMSPRRLRGIVILSIAGMLLIPGTTSVALAGWLGPNAHALEGKQNALDSRATLERIRAEGVPAKFRMIDEYMPGEPDTAWRTGAYSLERPEIAATCEEVISYASKNGATMLQQLPDGASIQISNHNDAVAACVRTMNTYPHKKRHKYEVISKQLLLSGVTNVEPRSPISFRLTLLKYGYTWEKPNTWGYELFISTDYGLVANNLSRSPNTSSPAQVPTPW